MRLSPIRRVTRSRLLCALWTWEIFSLSKYIILALRYRKEDKKAKRWEMRNEFMKWRRPGGATFPFNHKPPRTISPSSGGQPPPTVRAITRTGYVLTSWEMATILPPKPWILHWSLLSSFWGRKVLFIPQGFVKNAIEQWRLSWVRKHCVFEALWNLEAEIVAVCYIFTQLSAQ